MRRDLGDDALQEWEVSGDHSFSTLAEDSTGRLLDTRATGQARRRDPSTSTGGEAVRRGMIRYLYVVLDMSRTMGEFLHAMLLISFYSLLA